jgi:hypothetical protein
MTRLGALVAFPPHYAATAAGLVAAEEELARLTATHTAYAEQPDVSPIWQGYIDEQAGAVTAQQAIVEGLRRTIRGRFQALGEAAAVRL